MRIIKEVCTWTNAVGDTHTRCAIRTNTYAKSVDHVMDLLKIAKSDFPTLKEDDVQIVIYGGDRYRKTLGIEFDPLSQVPADYQKIEEMELTLA